MLPGGRMPKGTDMSDGDAADLSELEPPRRTGSLKTRSLVLGGVLVIAAGAALFTWRQVKPVVESRKYASVTYEVPKAPKLTPAEGETVYRIDPTASSLSYQVQEQFAGKDTSSAKGTTNGIAGDIAIDPTDLSATRVGTMVVNLEQLHSDNNLRDARLRLDYLESHEHPLATFEPDEVTGLEGKLVEGKAQDFEMTGDLTVKDITKPATFTGTATLDDGVLRTGTDSPVSSDSSTDRLMPRRRTASAGTRSPSARTIRSPRTTSRPAIRRWAPPRTTSARGLERSRSAARPSSRAAGSHSKPVRRSSRSRASPTSASRCAARATAR